MPIHCINSQLCSFSQRLDKRWRYILAGKMEGSFDFYYSSNTLPKWNRIEGFVIKAALGILNAHNTKDMAILYSYRAFHAVNMHDLLWGYFKGFMYELHLPSWDSQGPICQEILREEGAGQISQLENSLLSLLQTPQSTTDSGRVQVSQVHLCFKKVSAYVAICSLCNKIMAGKGGMHITRLSAFLHEGVLPQATHNRFECGCIKRVLAGSLLNSCVSWQTGGFSEGIVAWVRCFQYVQLQCNDLLLLGR